MCRDQIFLIIANNSRSEQNKINTEHPFVYNDYVGDACIVSTKKYSTLW